MTRLVQEAITGKEKGKMQAERRTLTVPEAAQLLGISKNSAYVAAQKGELPVVRIGKRFLVPRTALEAMLGEKLDMERQSSVA